MYPETDLPAPLHPAEFYALLALHRTTAHGYALTAMIRNLSLGSVNVPDSNIYRLISRLENEAFIEPAGKHPTGPSGIPRKHYAITHHGTLRLKEELARLNHATQVGRRAGLLENDTPLDMQRFLLEAEQS